MDTQAYEFGPYRLERATRRLLRGGEPVSLTPKAFDTLLALVDRHDRVVDKTELMELVWPDSVVEESNLSQTIFVLRKTLGEGPDGRPYIDTVPRRGYRFGAEVRQEGAKLAVAVDGDAMGQARWPRRTVAGIAVAAIATGLAVVSLTRLGQIHPSGAGLLADKTLVAVLPFENLTNDRADDWLASAFSDSLTSGLQRVDTLVPVSRDRIVELYRQQGIRDAAPADAGVLRQIAETLGVRYFVHGSYQRISGDIKVIARLVAADDGTIEAQETITDAYRNLLKLEDDLAGRFAARLQARPRRPGSSRETTSLEAYQAAVEGRTLYAQNRFTEALSPLTRAVAIDPQYAQAWALLGKTHARLSTIAVISSGSAAQLQRDALTHASRAVELAPDLYDAHVALALAYRGGGDFQRWRAEARKAIELNPSIAEAYALLADSYFAGNAFGCQRDRDPVRAEENYRAAINLDRRLSAAYSNLSYHFSWLGREDEALRVADEAASALPSDPNSARARALALVRLRRPDDAEREIRRMLDGGAAMSGQDHLILGAAALARGNADLAAREFRTTLSRLPTSAFHLAIGRAYLDNDHLEEGLTHLDEAVAIEPSCAAFAAASPAFARYRDAPPFRARLEAWKRPGT